MWGMLRFRLLLVLIVLPALVAAVLTGFAVHLFRSDKELSVFDLSTQTVELVGRNLATNLDAIVARAALTTRLAPPLLAIKTDTAHPSADGKTHFLVENISHPGQPRLRVLRQDTHGILTADVLPSALLELRGFHGPAEVMVVNQRGQLLLHSDVKRVQRSEHRDKLLRELRIFGGTQSRLGSREIDLDGTPSLVSYARVKETLAVVQAVAKQKVLAATRPFVTTAVFVSLGTVAVAVFLALLLARRIIGPVQLMIKQAEAIGRGDFGTAVEAQTDGAVAKLVAGFNEMSASLKQREEDLQQVQRRLLQAERLNTAGRMIQALVGELSAPVERCLSLAGKTKKLLPNDSAALALQNSIVEQADHAANVLQNLKHVASNETESPAEAVAADLALADTIAAARPLLFRHQITLVPQIDPTIVFWTNPDQLRNALLDIFLFVADQAALGSQVGLTVERAVDCVDRALLSVTYQGKPLGPPGKARRLEPLGREVMDGAMMLAVATMVLREHGGGLEAQCTADGNVLRSVLRTAGSHLDGS